MEVSSITRLFYSTYSDSIYSDSTYSDAGVITTPGSGSHALSWLRRVRHPWPE